MDPTVWQTVALSPDDFKTMFRGVLGAAARIDLIAALYLATGCAVRFLGEKFAYWGYFALAAAVQLGWH